MHIGPTRLFENGVSNSQYDLESRIYRKYGGLDSGDGAKIVASMAAINDNKNKVQDLRKKIRQLKTEKQYQR